jgi:hypothetical protein
MSKETSDAIIAIVALLGVLGSVVTFFVARVELHGQRKATEDLARLTSSLEHKVHLLATNLDQSIYRLNRVRDLITGLVQTSIGLRQKHRKQEDKLELAIKREMTFPELNALVATIGNVDLRTLNDQLMAILTGNEYAELWSKTWNDMDYDMVEVSKLIQRQAECTSEMHLLLLKLLEETTRIEGHSRNQF